MGEDRHGNLPQALTMPRVLPTSIALASAFFAGGIAFDAGATGTTPAHAVEIDWQTSPLDLDLRGMNGARYAFRCPHGEALARHVIGSGPYTDDSSICSAAVHAGALRDGDGGDVTIEIRPGESRYAGSERNTIRSNAYDHAWSGSFVVLKEGTASTR